MENKNLGHFYEIPFKICCRWTAKNVNAFVEMNINSFTKYAFWLDIIYIYKLIRDMNYVLIITKNLRVFEVLFQDLKTSFKNDKCLLGK